MLQPSKSLVFVESALAVGCAGLAVASMIQPDWIERLTGFEPDAGDGSAEWGVVAAFALAAIVAGFFARHHWQRLRTAEQRG